MDDSQEKLKPPGEKLEESQEGSTGIRRESREVVLAPTQEDFHKAREMVEAVQIDDDAKAQAASVAQGLAGVEDQEKLTKLLVLAKQKGVIFAVKAAQKLHDPYLLDMPHDKLVEGGHYKDFLK